MSLLASLILTLLAVAVGGLATWYVAKHYFEMSSRDLDRKIRRLERFLRSLAHLIDPEGTRYIYDEEGSLFIMLGAPSKYDGTLMAPAIKIVSLETSICTHYQMIAGQ